MKNNKIAHRYGLTVFCLGSLVAMVIGVLGMNGLGPIDDHHFIRTICQGKDFGAYIMPELGRFMPLTAQEYVLAAKIFEPSPRLFFVISAIKVFLCGVLLFGCLIQTRAGNGAVAILWAVVIFSIGFANAAFRLQVCELNVLLLMLLFAWSALSADKATLPLSKKQNIIATCGLAAIVAALFYKELTFIFALAFGFSELLRCYRQKQAVIPKRIWLLLIIGICYIVFYGFWRSIYVTGSYTSFHSIGVWNVIRLYATFDPFIIFIVLPLTAFRVFLFIYDANKQTISDSFMIAASAYAGAYFVLGMFNTYYLLPAYGLAVCGLAGILARQSAMRFHIAVLVITSFLVANTLPVAASDMQALKLIANNHYKFVNYMSDWLNSGKKNNPQQRNLVLSGVSAGSGIEIIGSLKTFLSSLGVSNSLFDVKVTEPVDNQAISSFYGVRDTLGYSPKPNDILIFNPYQQAFSPPPLQSPSLREIYRSTQEWTLPRWFGWHWIKFCVFDYRNGLQNIEENKRYAGYAAFLVVRQIEMPPVEALKSPGYRIGPLKISARLPAGCSQKFEVLIENTGLETWPAIGRLGQEGMYVNLAYRWFDKSGRVVLDGNRSPFPEPIKPGDKVMVPLLVKTPPHPGKYKLVISPVQERVRWFEGGSNKIINVY